MRCEVRSRGTEAKKHAAGAWRALIGLVVGASGAAASCVGPDPSGCRPYCLAGQAADYATCMAFSDSGDSTPKGPGLPLP